MLGLSDIRISICYCEHSLSAKSVIHIHPFSSSVLSQACMYTTMHEISSTCFRKSQSNWTCKWKEEIIPICRNLVWCLHYNQENQTTPAYKKQIQFINYGKHIHATWTLCSGADVSKSNPTRTDVLDARTLTVSCDFQTRHTNLSGDRRHVYLPYSGIPVPGTHMMSNSHAVE